MLSVRLEKLLMKAMLKEIVHAPSWSTNNTTLEKNFDSTKNVRQPSVNEGTPEAQTWNFVLALK